MSLVIVDPSALLKSHIGTLFLVDLYINKAWESVNFVKTDFDSHYDLLSEDF